MSATKKIEARLGLDRALAMRFLRLAENSQDPVLRETAAKGGFVHEWNELAQDEPAVFVVRVSWFQLSNLCRLLENDRGEDAPGLSLRFLRALHEMGTPELEQLTQRYQGAPAKQARVVAKAARHQTEIVAEVTFTLSKNLMHRIYELSMRHGNDLIRSTSMAGGFIFGWFMQRADPPEYERQVTATVRQLELICLLFEDCGPDERDRLDMFRGLLEEARATCAAALYAYDHVRGVRA